MYILLFFILCSNMCFCDMYNNNTCPVSVVDFGQNNYCINQFPEDWRGNNKEYVENKMRTYEKAGEHTEYVNYSWKGLSFSLVLKLAENSQCTIAINRLFKAAERMDLWALKMIDATGKIPSGILEGNINQYGNFDECLSISKAKYCLAEIEPVWRNDYGKFKNLVHSHYAFSGDFKDPPHRVPNYNNFKWGICLPRECSAEDLQVILERNLNTPTFVRPSLCQSSSKKINISFGHYITGSLLVAVLSAVFISSWMAAQPSHVHNSENILRNILLSFSIQQNWKRLQSTSSDKEIKAVHGIRTLSAIALYMSHKAVVIFFQPHINRTTMAEKLGSYPAVIGRTAVVYTDSFIFISGLLTANNILNELENKLTVNVKDLIVNRICRLLPSLLVTILFCTYILPNIGSGPLWPITVNHHSELCKKYMWRNVFFMHNYYGFDDMCLTHSHQIALEMQLFLIGPILIYILWLNSYIGHCIIGAIAILSSILRYWSTYKYELSYMVYFGISIRKMFDTANYSYMLPTHRVTIYVMGIYLAYMLKSKTLYSPRFRVKTLCWIGFVGSGLLAMFGPYHMALVGYNYNNTEAAVYSTLAPIAWALAEGWTIYSTNCGYGGWFGDMLSWKKFQIFSKISYAFYLTQFPILFYNVGIRRHSENFTISSLISIPETLTLFLASYLLTLFVEMPFQNMKHAIKNYVKPTK